MDADPTAHTQGGSVVQGNVTVEQGDFVGRDKVTNLFGLTRQQTWLLVIILLGVLVTVWLLLRPPSLPQPPAPLVGDFTIGIAEIRGGASRFPLLQSHAGAELGQEIYRQISASLQQTSLNFAIGIGDPAAIGSINGEGSERIAQASQKAHAVNANLLVFGTLNSAEAESTFTPELYIDPDAFPRAEEAADYFVLDSIHVAGDLEDNPASKKELRDQLAGRIEEYVNFSIGLGYLARDNYAEAAVYLQQAYNLAYKLQTNKDRTTILLMLGFVANRQGDYQAAYTYYNQAAAFDPDNARAILGKGQALFLLARQQCSSAKIDRDGIHAAQALIAEALTLTPLPYAEIQTKVALFQGHAHICLAEADDQEADWVAARNNYERVLRNYEANPSQLLRSLAAEASGGLALAILRADVRTLSLAHSASLAEALAALEQAAEWAHRPHRRAVFLLWQVKLQLARKDCAQAQARFAQADKARQSYLQKNPSQPDRGLEDLYLLVQDELGICSAGATS